MKQSLINTTGKSRSEIIMERLMECIHNGEVENDQLLQIFEHTGVILGLCTPSQYAKRHNISEQAAHKKDHKILFGYKFIIDNE
jgi:hypothetical protein